MTPTKLLTHFFFLTNLFEFKSSFFSEMKSEHCLNNCTFLFSIFIVLHFVSVCIEKLHQRPTTTPVFARKRGFCVVMTDSLGKNTPPKKIKNPRENSILSVYCPVFCSSQEQFSFSTIECTSPTFFGRERRKEKDDSHPF